MVNKLTNRYNIIRYYFRDARRVIVKRNVLLAEAQAHCSNPETSSVTCTRWNGVIRTRFKGPWFDSFETMFRPY